MASAWDGATARVSGHRLRRRTGTVFNYAEDAHLRDDLPCGCALCETCDNDAGIGDGRLDGTPVGTPMGTPVGTSPTTCCSLARTHPACFLANSSHVLATFPCHVTS